MDPLNPYNDFSNGSSVHNLTLQQLNELKDTISCVDYQSELKGKTVYHGTTESQAESVLSGPKNLGRGFGGNGFYVAVEGEKNLSETYAGNEFKTAKGDKGIVVEGKLQAEEMRVGKIIIAQRYHLPDISKGIFPADWSKDPVLQKFLNDNFDALLICNGKSAGYNIDSDRFLVIHEKAGSKAIKWNQLKLQKSPGIENFKQLIQQKGLTDSYKSSNPNNPISGQPGSKGDIGGVACSTAYIEGLFDTPESIFEKDHYFCTQATNGQIPFSDGELRQILRELAIGIYTHSTVPFFSLHFNQKTDLVPIIHPVYKDTLVGRVISMLDYIMKGYLNGGVFNEDFIDRWAQNPDWKTSTPLRQMIDFTEHCHTHLEGADKKYLSLRLKLNAVLMNKKGHIPVEEQAIFRDFSGFSNSFRIIAKQNSIQKEGNLFLLDSDFDVEYTINPTPEYKLALEQHIRMHGALPLAYELLIETYKEMSSLIHNHMVKMPICRNYFSMLGVINFFSAYFSTLKKHRKVPDLTPFELVNVKGSPALFPHLPLQAPFKELIRFRPQEILTKILENPDSKLSLWFYEVMENRDCGPISDMQKAELLAEFKKAICANILVLFSPTYRNYLEKLNLLQNKIESIEITANELALTFLNGILLKYANQISNKRFSERFSWNRQFDTAEGRQDFLKEFCGKVGLHDDYPITEVFYHSTGIVTDSTSKDVELGKRVVGGCGMKLTSQVAYSSEKAATIWKNHWVELLSLKYESWSLLSFKVSENDKKAVFRLKLKDLSPWVSGDYSWMESLLIAPAKKDSQLKRQKINAAMDSNDREKFKSFIEPLSLEDLFQMKDRYSRTLLHEAAALEDSFYMETLLAKGLSENAADVYGYKPIHYAAMAGAMLTMERLLTNNLNAKSYDGSTPLIVAIQNNKLEIVAKLLESGSQFTLTTVGFNPLHCALHQRNLAIVNMLLDNNPSRECLNEMAEEEGTPLMLACELDSSELIARLISMGADPAAKRKDGTTAIEIAIKRNLKKHIGCLLPHAKPSSKSIEEAVKGSPLEIVELLDLFWLNHKNSSGDTALHTAIRFGNIPVAMHIIEKSSWGYLTKVNYKNETAFDFATSFGLWDLVAKLISKGVEKNIFKMLKAGYHPTVREIFSKTTFSEEELKKALLMAAQVGNHEAITKILIPKGANIHDLKGPNDWGILHYLAACNGLFLFKQLIVKTGDRLSPLPKEGNKTLPYLAAEHGSKDVLRCLLVQIEKKSEPLENHYKDRHLFYAVMESGDIKQIQMMLEIFKKKQLENVVLDEEGTYPAHLAAKIGSKEILQLLSDYNVNLNIKDSHDFTPLDYAVRAQAEEAIHFLLEGDRGITVTGMALSIAASQSNKKIIELLTEFKPSAAITDFAVRHAIQAHDFSAFLSLLRLPKASLDSVSPKGWTPLIVASRHGRLDIVSYILEQTSSTPADKRSIKGNNALHFATKNRHVHCIKLLVEAGFDPTEKNLNGTDCIAFASREGVSTSVMSALLKDPVYLQKIENFQMALNGNFLKEDFKKVYFFVKNLPIFDTWKNWSCAKLIFKLIGDFKFELSPESIDLINENRNYTFEKILKKGVFSIKSDFIALKIAIQNLPLNETISISTNGYVISGPPLHLLLRLAKDKMEKAIVFEFLKAEELNLDLQDCDGNTLAHLLAEAEMTDFICEQEFLFHKEIDALIPSSRKSNSTHDKEHKNYKFPLPSQGLKLRNFKGESILHIASKNNSLEQLGQLIEMTVEDINLVDHLGRTPLFYAIELDLIRNVNFLLKHGANVRHFDHQLITPLHFACKHKMVPVVNVLLQNNADANQYATIDRTLPLHTALNIGVDEIVHSLLQHGADCHRVSRDGFHTVHIAAANEKMDLLRIFAGKGMSLNLKNPGGLRPIHTVAAKGKIEMVAALLAVNEDSDQFLIEEGSESNLDGALQIAAESGQSETMQYLLDHFANPETKNIYDVDTLALTALSFPKSTLESLLSYKVGKNSDSLRSAIIRAISKDEVDSMIALYKQGITPNLSITERYTGLHLASVHGALHCTQWLLKKGVDPLIPCESGENAFEISASNSSYEQFSLLLNYTGVDVDLQNGRGETLLHIAAKNGKFAHVALLIRKGASINPLDSARRTPLDIAVKEGHAQIVSLLLICGAKLLRNATEKSSIEMASSEVKEIFSEFEESKNDETWLHSAIRNQNSLVVSLLAQIVDVDHQDLLGNTPLHLAVQTCQMKCIRYLLQAGAKVDIANKAGHTPLWYALELQDLSITQDLLDAGADAKMSGAPDQIIEDALKKLNLHEAK